MPNNAGPAAAEVMEGRDRAKGNTREQNALRTQSRDSAPNALSRVRQRAKVHRGERFTALFHHVDIERLRSAYFTSKKDAAPGTDGVT